jgi:predicted permease
MRWSRFFHRSHWDRERSRELEAHLQIEADENVAKGMSPEEARYAARRKLGNPSLVREEIYDMNSIGFFETLAQDLRYAVRRLRRSPGFALVCVLTLALGIGANTAIFTLVDAVMLRSLPVANPAQLYRLGDNNNCCMMTGTQNDGSFVLYSYPLYQDLRDHTAEFSELAAFQPFLSDLSVRRNGTPGPAEPFNGELVSGNYFAMLGVTAFAGRELTPADDRPGAPPAAVMSYHTWQTHFGADPSVIGSTVTINTMAYTVAGVAPPGFYGETLRSDPTEFWLPLGTEPALNRQDSRLRNPELEWLYLIGRLKPGVAAARAQSHLTIELQQWLWSSGYAQATTEQRNDKALVEEYRQEIARQHIRLTPAGGGVDSMQTKYAASLRLLMTAAGLVLLIACANIANLLLARGTASQLQMAIRLALGGPRRRLMRQMLTESVVLALAGGAVGVYVAYAGTRTILLLAFRGAHYVPISPDPSLQALGFAFLLSLATGIVFGVAPAWIHSRANPGEVLHGAGRSTGDRHSMARNSLVVLQVGLSLVLLAAAGLLTESLRKLQDQQFGFETSGRLMVKVDPALAGYTAARRVGLYQELQQRLGQIPGVLSASLSGYSPMEHQNWNQDVYIEGRRPANDSGQYQNSSLDRVGAHYFETIGTRLLRGRSIGDQTASALHEAVINRTFATKFFPHEDPIGQHFGIGGPSHSGDYEIVGIVEDAKYTSADEPANPTAFLPLMTPLEAAGIHDIELHVAGKPENFEPEVRRAMAGIDPNLTLLDMVSFGEQVALNFNQERLIARLTELFGLLALVLACVGVYGVTAYSVARRTNEIGIRMALGAGRRTVLGLVLRGALVQVGLGLAIGIPVAVAGGRLLASELYGVKGHEPVIFALAAVLLAICALAAGFLPARRASALDPIAALRQE